MKIVKMYLFTQITLILAILLSAKCRISQKHEICRGGKRLILKNRTESCTAESDSLKDPTEGRQELSDSTLNTYTLKMFPEPEVLKIKLEIELKMQEPNSYPALGECIEKFEITDGIGESKIPVLCGVVGNKTLYIDVNSNDGDYIETKITMHRSSVVPKINSISYLTESDRDRVPQGCLQYYTEPTGTVQSFNFGGQVGNDIPYKALINQVYKICFEKIDGYCNINLKFKRFDLGEINLPCKDDYLLIGGRKICGDFGPDEDIPDLPTSVSLPTTVEVFMDDDNMLEVEGFSGTYTMIPCNEPSARTSKPPPATSKPSKTNSKPNTTPSIFNFLNLFW